MGGLAIGLNPSFIAYRLLPAFDSNLRHSTPDALYTISEGISLHLKPIALHPFG